MRLFPGLPQSVTFPIGFQDVASVSESVKEGPGEPFGAKDLRPFLEGQICSHHKTVMFIGLADDLEEQLRPRLGEGNVSQLIDYQQVESLKLLVQPLQPLFFPALHELSLKVGGVMETKLSEHEFVIKTIKKLSHPPYKGIHSVYSGFNHAFREYFNKDPVEATTRLAQERKVVARPVRGGVTLYLHEDAPAGSKGVLHKILDKDDKTQ